MQQCPFCNGIGKLPHKFKINDIPVYHICLNCKGSGEDEKVYLIPNEVKEEK